MGLVNRSSKMKAVADTIGYPRRAIVSWDLPAGWSCPGATECLTKAARHTGQLKDGPACRYRCFAAVSERYPAVRDSRWGNYDLLRKAGTVSGMLAVLQAELIRYAEQSGSYPAYTRLHSSGDIFNRVYMQALILWARMNPAIVFYGYTKMANLVEEYSNQFPANLRIVVSAGGRYDDRAPGYRRAYVVYSYHEAAALGIPAERVYNDESTELAIIEGTGDFAILIHGTQPEHVQQAVAAAQLFDIN